MKIFHKIKIQLLIYGLCISLIPLMIIFFVYQFNAREIIKKHQFHELVTIAEYQKNNILTLLNAKKSRAIDFSTDGQIINFAEKVCVDDYDQKDTIALQQHLVCNKKSIDPDIIAINISNITGEVVAATGEMIPEITPLGDTCQQSLIADIKGDSAHIGIPVQSFQDKYTVIPITAKISSKNKGYPIGFVTLYYDFQMLNAITKNLSGLGKTGEIILACRNENQTVFLNPLKYASHELPYLQKRPISFLPMQYALQGNKGKTIATDYYGKLSVAVYDYIPSIRGGLVVKMDKTEVFKPITTITFVSLITIGICSAMAICFGFLFSFSLSKIIGKMKAVTEKVAAGNLKERVPIQCNNELGDLAKSFNRMADILSTEILNHKQTEALLRENKEILSSILDNTTTIIYLKDLEGRHTFINKEFERKFNTTRSQIIGKTNNDLFPKDLADILNANDDKVLHSKEPLEFEETVPVGNTRLTYLSVKFPLYDKNGTIYSICGLSTDITERKHTEDELRLQGQIMQHMAEGVTLVNMKDFSILYANPKFENMFGYGKGELNGRHVSILNDPAEKDPLQTANEIMTTLKNTGEWCGEIKNIRKDRTSFWCYASVSVFNHPVYGKILISVHNDITERKQIETVLHNVAEFAIARSGKETVQMLVKNIAHVLIADYVLVAELIKNNTMAQTIAVCAHGEIKENFIYSLAGTPCEAVIKKQACFYSDNVQQKFPEDLLLIEMGVNNYIGIPLLSLNQEPIGILVVLFTKQSIDFKLIENTLKIYEFRVSAELEHIKNEEEQERLKEQLYHAQRMESVGRLAGGIAHDFNNVLTAIMGYSSILQMETEEYPTLKEYAQKIISSSEKAAKLTQNLLAFSRKQIINLKHENLNTIVKDALIIIEQLLREDIVYKTLLKDEDLPILVDSGQIEQALVNLVSNAKDAMPEGGTLTIHTDIHEFDIAFIQEHGFGIPGKYALLSVSDTGTGMSDEVLKNIFEPFYTTKEVNKGTGLGLSSVYGIITQHKGYIDVQSKPGKGSTFTLYIPVTEEKIEEMKTPLNLTPLHSRNTATILVADDEISITEITREILIAYGYKVILAQDGRDAINKYEKNKEDISLLLFDLKMPNKNGICAFNSIKTINNDIKIIFMSGYASDIDLREEIIRDNLPCLQKPFRPSELLHMITTVLNN